MLVESSDWYPPSSSSSFESTPWLCGYWPVRNVARDGQQSGNEAKLLVNVAPSPPSCWLVWLMKRIESAVWSSDITTTTLGRSSFCFLPVAGVAEPAAAARAQAASTAAASEARRDGLSRVVFGAFSLIARSHHSNTDLKPCRGRDRACLGVRGDA